MLNNFTRYILDKNKTQKNKTALIDDEKSLMYGELEDYVLQFSAVLKNKVDSGTRVLMLMDDCVEWNVAVLSIIAIGAVPVLASIDLGHKAIVNIIKLSDAQLVISSLNDEFGIQKISKEEILVSNNKTFTEFYDWHPDENCWWYLTSGTSGDPKCMIHRHDNLYTLPELIHKNALQITQDSINMASPKLQFAYGFGVFLSTLYTGSTQVLSSGKPAPSKIFKKLHAHKVTNFFSTVYVLNSIRKHKQEEQFPSSVKYIVSSGEPLPESLDISFKETFNIPIVNGLGMAELGQIFCIQDSNVLEFGTIGRPIPQVEFEVRDENGHKVAPGQPGELYVRSPCMATFYWKNWQKTKDTFYGPWLRTGDCVVELPSGNYKFLARVNGGFKINNEYVTPTEIESVILDNDAILDCMVVFKNTEIGEIHAHVVSKNNTVVDLKDYLKLKLPAYKIPKYFHFSKELPTTVTGKKLRRAFS
jgi:acyl-coenzyme A synthetase/AMP-(fatty) acid ligase